MPDLLNDTNEAQRWAKEAIERQESGLYGQIVSAVVWTDARGEDGSLLVEADPQSILSTLRRQRLPLLLNHDPGRPMGQVLEAEYFEAPDGQTFVAAIIGYYSRDQVLTFADLGLDSISAPPIGELPEPHGDLWIEIACDPREISHEWLDVVAAGAPMPIVRTPLSHNSSEAVQELIRIGIVFVLLVGIPAAKALGTELGKDIYAGVSKWLKNLIASTSKHQAPLICIESYQQDCQVSFLIRGNDVLTNYAAHDGISQAAAQAARIIGLLAKRGMPASKLVYEFDTDSLRWYPSYAALENNRLITSSPMLIAMAADTPTGLSLGLARKDMGERQ